MLLCSIWVVLFAGPVDCYVIDSVSFPIPILRCRNRKVLYYCHYPDKYLSTNRRTFCIKLYRGIIDFCEEVSTGMAHTTLVNSNFTQSVYIRAFPLIQRCFRNKTPKVLYPAINPKNFMVTPGYKETIQELLAGFKMTEKTRIVLSLNRYERKKNIGLALESFAEYLETYKPKDIEPLLVIAGGYDQRVLENVEHHLELNALAKKLGIADKVCFLRSISNDQRLLMLKNTQVLLYTPENEHFGIVPVEAMHLGCIVIACNSGGPLESVDDQHTGYLLGPVPELWAEKINRILTDSLEIDRDTMLLLR
jgi:alpha-1,3/alpha-1,6-mannosyltransferase